VFVYIKEEEWLVNFKCMILWRLYWESRIEFTYQSIYIRWNVMKLTYLDGHAESFVIFLFCLFYTFYRREAASVRDEHIPTSGGSLSSLGHHHPPSQDMEDQKLCGNLWQVSNPFPDRLRDALPGSRDELRQCLQHHHENILHMFRRCHRLPDVRQVQSHLWR